MPAEKRGFALLQAGFLVFFAVLLLWRGVFPAVVLAAVTVLSVLAVRLKPRLPADLLPFAILLLCYEAQRPFVRALERTEINASNLIAWERALTGGMPAAWLRESLRSSGLLPLLDMGANLVYFSHFIVPVGLAIWLHGSRRQRYWPLLTRFFVLCYAGFATYLLFPAAPPWWATEQGLLTGPEAVSLDGFLLPVQAMANTPNPLAAMPSMHCAFPLFWALAVRRLAPRLALGLGALALAVGVSVVYLGHHYVVDVVAGYLYAVVAAFRLPGLTPSEDLAQNERP